MADTAATGNGPRAHWITGVSIVSAFLCFFWAGVQWQTVQGVKEELPKMEGRLAAAIDRLENRTARIESDHVGAIPALRKLEADYQQLERELRRMQWRLDPENRSGPR